MRQARLGKRASPELREKLRQSHLGKTFVVKDQYAEWTKYHIIHTRNGWKFYREGMKRGIATRRDRNSIIKDALYRIAGDGGVLWVHYKDGAVDFKVGNWTG